MTDLQVTWRVTRDYTASIPAGVITNALHRSLDEDERANAALIIGDIETGLDVAEDRGQLAEYLDRVAYVFVPYERETNYTEDEEAAEVIDVRLSAGTPPPAAGQVCNIHTDRHAVTMIDVTGQGEYVPACAECVQAGA